jgi:endo-beta-N-acetylglucosaminidase D
MAKKKAATKKKATAAHNTAPNQTTILMYVPDSIYNLGNNMDQFIGATNLLWAKWFGVTQVVVDKNSNWP